MGLPSIKWNQIFEIVPDRGRNDTHIWRLRFKHSNELMPMYATRKEETCIPYMERWIKKNEQLANDIVFEIEVLQKEIE